MRKIGIFLYSMAAGGAERVVSNLLTELVKRYKIYLILMNDTIFYDLPKEVEVVFLEKSNPNESGVLKFAKLPFLGVKLKQICQNLELELLFALMNRPCYAAGFSRIFGLKIPIIMSERSTPSVLYKDDFKGKINKNLIKFLYKKADFIFANSSGNLADLRENFGILDEKSQILHNAIDIDFMQKLAKEPVDEPSLSYFLSIGRLDYGKNHQMTIKAYSKLKNKDKKLLIIGNGELKNELENLIKSLNLTQNVRLLGHQKNPYKYIKNCYAFLCASSFEGFSNVLLEALALGKFIISTDHKSGARELLGDDEYGILFGVGDEDCMKNKMEIALNDENLVKIYQNRAFDRALLFDKAEISKKLCEKIDELCEK